jgi:hypothetical protein
MIARRINRSTLKNLSARRRPRGVEVQANFEASKISGEVGRYYMVILLNPASGAVVDIQSTILNRKGGSDADQTRRSKDTQWDLAKDLADIFLKSEAWKILREREPDHKYVIDQYGKRYGGVRKG